MRNVLLSVHIIAVCLWFGGSVMNGVINTKLMRSENLSTKADLAVAETNLGTVFYMPAAVVTLLSGIGLALVGEFDFASIWITFGVLAIVVAAALGPLKFQPLSNAIAEGYQSGDTAKAAAAVKEITMWSSINTGLLLVAIVLMVFKPGG